MTAHLFLTATQKPACGAAVVKGDTITQAYYRDLCKACRDWQQFRCQYWAIHKQWPPT